MKLKWVTNTWLDRSPMQTTTMKLDDRTATQSTQRCQVDAEKTIVSKLDLTGKVIGDPKATEQYTADQLAGMGMVGVYVYVEEEINA